MPSVREEETQPKRPRRFYGYVVEMSCVRGKQVLPSPVEPTTRSFNIVINAWAKSGEKDSGRRAEQIFSRMESGMKNARIAHGFHGAVAECKDVEWRDGCLGSEWCAKCRGTGPDEYLMHAIQKWRKRAVGRRDGGSLVQETCIKPNGIMFNSAMLAWVNSGRGRVGAEKMEGILRMMEQLNDSGELGKTDEHDEDDVGLKPTTRTLSLIVDAWAECEKVGKTGEGGESCSTLSRFNGATLSRRTRYQAKLCDFHVMHCSVVKK